MARPRRRRPRNDQPFARRGRYQLARLHHSPTRMPDHSRVLVVDTDGARATSLIELLAPAGYDTCHAASADAPRLAADLMVLSVDAVDGAIVARTAAAAPEAVLLVVTS